MDKKQKLPYTGKGKLINSGEFSGLDSEEAKKRIVEKLEKLPNLRKLVFYRYGDTMEL